jgi:hypothetical protein
MKITIEADNTTVEATVSDDAVAAMNTFIAEQNDDGKPRYASIAELLIKHFRDSLATPLVQRYSAAVAEAEAARVSANLAAAESAAGTVVVKVTK